jgi:hypothetical protein
MQNYFQGRGLIGRDDQAPCPCALPEDVARRRHAHSLEARQVGPERDLITTLDGLRDRKIKFRPLTGAIDTEAPIAARKAVNPYLTK